MRIGRLLHLNMTRDLRERRNLRTRYVYYLTQGHQATISPITQHDKIRLDPKLSHLNNQNHQTMPTSKLKPQLITLQNQRSFHVILQRHIRPQIISKLENHQIHRINRRHQHLNQDKQLSDEEIVLQCDVDVRETERKV